MPRLKNLAKKSFKLFLLIIGVFLIGLGANGFFSRWDETRTKPTTPKVISDLTAEVTNSTNTPSENDIDIKSQFKVAKDMPKIIRLPSINSEGFIQKVSIDQHDAIAVPSNIHYAGWFTQSSKPGQEGLSIIDGHVSGKYSEGIFKRLEKIKVKDTFEVEYGDGSSRRFEVVSVKSYPEAEASRAMLFQNQEISSQLNLITCAGKFDAKTQKFSDRVIVVSKFISS